MCKVMLQLRRLVEIMAREQGTCSPEILLQSEFLGPLASLCSTSYNSNVTVIILSSNVHGIELISNWRPEQL